MPDKIHVVEVKNRHDLSAFLKLPDLIYQDYPHYIKPLNLHSKMMLGTLKQEHKHILLAKKNNLPVARIACKTHRHGNETRLHYGFFECLPGEKQATHALIEYMQKLYPSHWLRGPYHFRMEDPYVGNLVAGHDQDPYVFMPYSPPYYDEYLTEAGLAKAMDLYTFLITVTHCPPLISKIAQRSVARGAQIRWLDPRKMKSEVRLIADIFNDALSENWGFEPITDDQLAEMYLVFKYIMDTRLVCFTMKDGKETGCTILFPNLSPLFQRANGKLSLAFLWDMFRNRRKYTQIRGYAQGMRKGHQGSGNVCMMIDALYARAVEMGLTHCEISWVLANNRPMTELAQSMGGVHNKTYRVYEKAPLQN